MKRIVLGLHVVVLHLHVHGVVEGQPGVRLPRLRLSLGNLPVVPEDVANDLSPVSLVHHQAVDPVIEGLVVVEPHPARVIFVLVSGDVHTSIFLLSWSLVGDQMTIVLT